MMKCRYLILLLVLALTGCFEEKDEITEVDNPENVGVAFFEALYNERNVKKAAKVCSPKLAKLVLHYQTPQAVARHLFNLSYDKVDIKPDDSGVKLREQFKGSAVITFYFDGYYQDDRIKNVKRLSFVQIGGEWYVDKILKDPF